MEDYTIDPAQLHARGDDDGSSSAVTAATEPRSNQTESRSNQAESRLNQADLRHRGEETSEQISRGVRPPSPKRSRSDPSTSSGTPRSFPSTASGTDTTPSDGAAVDAPLWSRVEKAHLSAVNSHEADPESERFLEHCVFLFDQARTILAKQVCSLSPRPLFSHALFIYFCMERLRVLPCIFILVWS